MDARRRLRPERGSQARLRPAEQVEQDGHHAGPQLKERHPGHHHQARLTTSRRAPLSADLGLLLQHASPRRPPRARPGAPRDAPRRSAHARSPERAPPAGGARAEGRQRLVALLRQRALAITTASARHRADAAWSCHSTGWPRPCRRAAAASHFAAAARAERAIPRRGSNTEPSAARHGTAPPRARRHRAAGDQAARRRLHRRGRRRRSTAAARVKQHHDRGRLQWRCAASLPQRDVTPGGARPRLRTTTPWRHLVEQAVDHPFLMEK